MEDDGARGGHITSAYSTIYQELRLGFQLAAWYIHLHRMQ
jgi:hypothetical protein